MGSSDFPEGHPCVGKNCLTCETCIFDRELFPNKETPNESFITCQYNRMAKDTVRYKYRFNRCIYSNDEMYKMIRDITKLIKDKFND
jgi:hypothetical protein